MIGEVWRLIPSLPEYLASSEGRVMRVPFIGEMPKGGSRHYGGEPHFGVWNKTDGRFIVIHRNKTYKVHRLICEAFNGPPPEGAEYCLHIDENAANNRPSNLKWGTQKENLNADAFIAYCEERTGKDSPWIRGRLSASKSNGQ